MAVALSCSPGLMLLLLLLLLYTAKLLHLLSPHAAGRGNAFLGHGMEPMCGLDKCVCFGITSRTTSAVQGADSSLCVYGWAGGWMDGWVG